MRIAHIGDTHLLYRMYGLSARAQDFESAFLAMCKAIAKKKPDLLVIAGDLFESTVIKPAAFEAARQGIDLVGATTIIIPGNHDKAMYSKDKTWLEMLPDNVVVAALNGPELVVSGENGSLTNPVSILCTPYYGHRLRAGIQGALDVVQRDYDVHDGPLCLLGHFGVMDLMPGLPSTISIKELWATLEGYPIDFVMVGHFHYPYGENGAGVFSAGAVERRSFIQPLGGCWFHDWNGEMWDHSYLGIEEVHEPRCFFEVTADTVEQAIQLAKAQSYEGAVIRFVFTGDMMPSRTTLWEAFYEDSRPLEILTKDSRTPITHSGTGTVIVAQDVERKVFLRQAGNDERLANVAQELFGLASSSLEEQTACIEKAVSNVD